LGVCVASAHSQALAKGVSLRWTKTLAPDVSYHQEVSFDPPLIIHSVRFAYPSQGMRFETVLAADAIFPQDGRPSRESPVALARRLDALVVVNADFFSMTGESDGVPLGVMLSRGKLASEPYAGRSTVAWADSALLFDIPRFDAKITTPDGREIPINGLNRRCKPGEIVVYNDLAGRAYSQQVANAFIFEEVKTEEYHKETFLQFKLVVPDVSNLVVQPGQWVFLVAPGKEPPFMETLSMPGIWKLDLNLRGDINWRAIQEAIGGGPRLVRNGQVAVSGEAERFQRSLIADRHPRTALGYTASGEVVLVVVDGRSPISRGVTLAELARIMARMGCQDAINLDGGGSSAMVLAGNLINRPSDGTPRPIANALALFVPKPQIMLRELSIRSQTTQLLEGQKVVMTLKDAEGAVIENADILWLCEGRSAWIDQGGTLRALSPGTVKVKAVTPWGQAELIIEIRQKS
jgi:hypothetical protein